MIREAQGAVAIMKRQPNTVSHLEELGIHDEGLRQLQELVAQEIESIYASNEKV
ncbi:MAG: hypothetical protein HC855_03560 [Rhizobiales bacterium]|nr:hypothetical protein [Hyphomicrobiales bacterium]